MRLSAKKIIINKDRFSKMPDISSLNAKKKSRFEDRKIDEKIEYININLLDKAPEEWNFYKKLPEDKFYELLESIRENFLLNPIIVWEKENNYMILSGHNRVEAFRKLYEITGDDKYLKIPSIVRKRLEIDEDMAKEIIVDTNWVQRQLTASEKTKSILAKYTNIKKRKEKGRTRDKIANSYGITGRMVQNYLSLNNLIENLFDDLDSGKITIKEAVEISKKDKLTQEYISLELEENKVNLQTLKKIPKISTREEVKKILETKNENIRLTIEIPAEKKDEFYELFNNWKKTNHIK